MDIKDELLKISSADEVKGSQSVQTLWSGYGELVRYHLAGGKHSSLIVKDIRLPKVQGHPRGWNTDYSHQRKLKSYQVETCWYQNYASKTNEDCRVPRVFKVAKTSSTILIIMEDLNASGYDVRMPNVTLMPNQKNRN
ncbi:MAG: hypothetical protein AAF391_09060 [Bacteroidota bacterium]